MVTVSPSNLEKCRSRACNRIVGLKGWGGAKGLCQGHYIRLKNGGNIHTPLRPQTLVKRFQREVIYFPIKDAKGRYEPKPLLAYMKAVTALGATPAQIARVLHLPVETVTAFLSPIGD